MSNIKVMLLAKQDNPFCDYAACLLNSCFSHDEVVIVRGLPGTSIDEELCWHRPEYLISFLSPWIIPQTLLNAAQIAAINFHPGSPDYPGTGCYNFAIYEQAQRYGVTCHHMKAQVDTGDIIMTSYFDVAPYETVETLKLKSMTHLLFCYEKILFNIVHAETLPQSDEVWRRKPFTRKKMLELFLIDPNTQNEHDMLHRIRAAAYPSSSGAYTLIAGTPFYAVTEKRKPIV